MYEMTGLYSEIQTDESSGDSPQDIEPDVPQNSTAIQNKIAAVKSHSRQSSNALADKYNLWTLHNDLQSWIILNWNVLFISVKISPLSLLPKYLTKKLTKIVEYCHVDLLDYKSLLELKWELYFQCHNLTSYNIFWSICRFLCFCYQF